MANKKSQKKPVKNFGEPKYGFTFALAFRAKFSEVIKGLEVLGDDKQ